MKVYVYAHLYNKSIFYIGMGGKKRLTDRNARNEKWKEFVSKIDKYEIEILGEFENRRDARDLERALIDKHLPCCNVWTKDYTFSDDSNKARSAKLKNKVVSNETRLKMSAMRSSTIKTKKKDGTYKARPRPSDEEIKRTVERSSIPILCLNNGAVYQSSRDAGRNLGICYKLINRVSLGQRKHTKGYMFKKLSNNIGTETDLA